MHVEGTMKISVPGTGGPATPNDKVEVREWTYERIRMGWGCTNSVRVC